MAITGWRTDGNLIKSGLLAPGITLKSIGWFGFETANYVVHGLWARKMSELVSYIKSLKFNSIRIPWSNDILKSPTPMPNGIDYDLNSELKGKDSLKVLDYLIDLCKDQGLYVILDRHRPNKDGQSELWYTNQVSNDTWINDWKTIAGRYKDKEIVIGADLHN